MTRPWVGKESPPLLVEPSAWHLQLPSLEVLVIFASNRTEEDPVLTYQLALDTHPLRFIPVVAGQLSFLDEAYTKPATDFAVGDFDWRAAEGAGLVQEPDAWRLLVLAEHVLTVYANDLVESGGEHLFTLAVASGPPHLPVLRISSRLVTSAERLGPASQHHDVTRRDRGT